MNTNRLAEFNKPLNEPSVQLKIDQAMLDAVKKHHIKIAGLTEKQTAHVFKQAIFSGDIKKLLVVQGAGKPSEDGKTTKVEHTQQVVYLPFALKEELETKIQVYRALLKQHGISDPHLFSPQN